MLRAGQRGEGHSCWNNIESRAPREFQEAALDTGHLLPSLVWDMGLGTWPSCPVHPRDVPGWICPQQAVGQGVAVGEQPLWVQREDNVTFPPINEDFGL